MSESDGKRGQWSKDSDRIQGKECIVAWERQARQEHTEDETSQEGEQGKQSLLTNSDVPDTGETYADLHTLGLLLIAELSACVQRVSSDLAQAHDALDAGDLELARQRWAQQLRALADLAEMAEGVPARQQATLLPSETPLSALPPYPRRNATTQPITVDARIPVASAASPDATSEPSSQEMPINPPLASTYRWVPLTAREREVLKWTQRGYPPRRIAPRLVVSVETVYTHLRNIRRKQRAWEQEHLAQQETPTRQPPAGR